MISVSNARGWIRVRLISVTNCLMVAKGYKARGSFALIRKRLGLYGTGARWLNEARGYKTMYSGSFDFNKEWREADTGSFDCSK